MPLPSISPNRNLNQILHLENNAEIAGAPSKSLVWIAKPA